MRQALGGTKADRAANRYATFAIARRSARTLRDIIEASDPWSAHIGSPSPFGGFGQSVTPQVVEDEVMLRTAAYSRGRSQAHVRTQDSPQSAYSHQSP